MADEPKKPNISISQDANRPTEKPMLYRGVDLQRSASEQAANTPSPQKSALQEAAKRASRKSRAPAPPPPISEGSSNYRPDVSAPLASVRESIQRAARISDECDAVRDNLPPVPPLPPTPARDAPPSGQPMHWQDRWLFLVLAWMAIPAGIFVAGFVALYSGAPHWGAAGIFIGLLGVSAASLHLWEKKPRPPNPSPFLVGCAISTWLFVGWQTWLAFHKPVQGYTQAQLDKAVEDAENKSAAPAGFTQQQVNEKISTAVANLNAQLAEANRQKDAERREADAFRQQIQNAPPRPPTPEEQVPISWQPDFQLNWYAGPKIAWIRFIGVSAALARIKDAYVISTLTGHKEQLDVANATNLGERWRIDQVEPIPSGAQVILVYEPKPSPPLPDFMSQWGAFEFHVVYDNKEYIKIYSQDYINSKMTREMPGVFGPRVTPRDVK